MTVQILYKVGEKLHKHGVPDPVYVTNPVVGTSIINISQGNVEGQRIIQRFGERESMGTTSTGEDIWRGNELTPSPGSSTTIPLPAVAGEQMTVVSEHAGDTSNGVGVRTLSIEYLDANGIERDEIVTMDGTTPVNMVATNVRFVQAMHSVTVGNNGVAMGHIKIYRTGTTNRVYSMIAAGGNMSLLTNWMVPAGKTLYLQDWHCSEAENVRVAYRIRSTDYEGELFQGVFLFKDACYLMGSSSGSLPVHATVPAFSIVKISAWPDQVNGEGSASWRGILVDND